jgi:NADH:ubiquinone oxidoreductase subunit 3 (subunit A)
MIYVVADLLIYLLVTIPNKLNNVSSISNIDTIVFFLGLYIANYFSWKE